MNFKVLFIVVLILGISQQLDICHQYQDYSTCVQSSGQKCMWDNIRRICYRTTDYLQGCSLMLNKDSCIRQLGDVFGNLVKCRFTDRCEEIPDLMHEVCYNNLSKYGCLSLQNPEYVCIWSNNQCVQLDEQLWSQIQNNFESILYSASACQHISKYLIIHNTLLWDLIDYTPDLLTEAQNLYKEELGIIIENTISYDDPSTVFMQNNYEESDGTFVWYILRESKSITLTNLQISSRYREGCIALEIESDTDYTNIFSLTGDVNGINHVYCKYLNNNPSITDTYLFSTGGCKIYNDDNLNNQVLINQYQLNCYSLNLVQCVYFDSINQQCEITSDSYEYPCIILTNNSKDCTTDYCTTKQCKVLNFYYIDETTNMCVNTCLNQSAYLCECTLYGSMNDEISNVCGPTNGCDQAGMNKNACILLKSKCNWNNELNRCYTLSDTEIMYMRCVDAINIYVCTQISISDQMCYWNQTTQTCINILEQPLLMTHFVFLDSRFEDSTLTNENLCKFNQRVSTEYDPTISICHFYSGYFTDNLLLINKYRCVLELNGYCLWDSQQQICKCLSNSEMDSLQCLNLIDVNEKLCQKASVSSTSNICIYNQNTYSCEEINQSQLSNIECDGYGLSQSNCLSKNNNSCQYQAGLCQTISQANINSIRCSSLQKVNSQVCLMQSIYQVNCVYDSTTNSCYQPSIYNTITYNQYLNRYACQAVSDLTSSTTTLTYFDIVINKCIQILSSDTYILNQLTCEGQFVNQHTCLLITTSGQNCYWDTTLTRCRNYNGYFNNCTQYTYSSQKVCAVLQSDLTKQFMNEAFCIYTNGACATRGSQIYSDCQSTQNMNVHFCSAWTGRDSSTSKYTTMCAFLNNKCTQLTSNTMDSLIVLNSLNCIQANLLTCVQIQTPGQYCQALYSTSSNNVILNIKCNLITDTTTLCSAIATLATTTNTYLTGLQINPIHCSRASDACQYNSTSGCVTPTSTTLDCVTQGLSKTSCLWNTTNNSCAFINYACNLISEYSSINDCNVFNQFLCTYNQHVLCTWDTTNGCLKVLLNGTYSLVNSEYTCSIDTTSQYLAFQIQNNNKMCIIPSDLTNYTCNTPGINSYTCQRIPNQYCMFNNNQCHFYYNKLCEDTLTTCSTNDTPGQYCIKINNTCTNINNIVYDCDYFEETNYQFCKNYPSCIYLNHKCIQKNQQQQLTQCDGLNQLSCIIQNKQLQCKYLNNICIQYIGNQCPNLNGFYSYQVCLQYNNCLYGYTKSGFGFCYQNTSFTQLTCEQLPQSLCLEDLSHHNSNLKCYWNTTCKTIGTQSCQDINGLNCNYDACLTVINNNDCIYSQIQQMCLPTANIFTSTDCNSAINITQCSLIQNTCYFDGTQCSTTIGTISTINKFGCIGQSSGLYQFYNNLCQLVSSNLYSCNNLSKQTCLSQYTDQLHCRWYNNKCIHVYYHENRQLTSCTDLSKLTCLNVYSIPCTWNSTTRVCSLLSITTTDCTSIINQSNTSYGLCGTQTGNCTRYSDGTQCTTITVNVPSCSKYGLNQNACINLTSVPCQWINGYCKSPNLYKIQCSDNLNQLACNQVLNPQQYCQWSNGVCNSVTLTDCASANYLNGSIPCKSITSQSCQYDSILNTCTQLTNIPTECKDNLNKIACSTITEVNCSWIGNTCILNTSNYECSLILNQQLCLTNNIISCQWLNNQCTDFNPLTTKIFCINLPTNINDYACQTYAIDPCFYDTIAKHCISAQPPKNSGFTYDDNDTNYYQTIKTILKLQVSSYYQPLLSATCENLKTMNDCVSSRKLEQSCLWNNSQCTTINNYDTLQCNQSLNIYGCLKITTTNQLCMWKGKCLNYLSSLNIMTNININVCIQYSVNSIYQNYTCYQTDGITCLSSGISKITCLSLTSQQCQWNNLSNQCVQFVQQEQQQCSDYQLVSPYVCQQLLISCTYDSVSFSCTNADLTQINDGLSKQGCLLNNSIPTYWDGQCYELETNLECDSSLLVNSLACRNVDKIACFYNSSTSTCTSIFNPNSLRCSSPGLNKYGCANVLVEACIFKNGQCTQFNDINDLCMNIQNVNAMACASVLNQECLYDSINLKCISPFTSNDYCNTQGISQLICENKSQCKWSQDHLDCKCSSLQIIDQCQIESVSQCKLNSLCQFENTKCVRKQCYHLSTQNCLTTLDGKTCYLSQNNGCQPATTCEDIVNPASKCSSILINSTPCIQALNKCVSSTNYENICPYSDCTNSNCFYDSGICRKKECTDLNSTICQTIEGCYLDESNICQTLLTCSQITSINQCNQLVLNGFKCNWQKFALLDDTEICTNQPCEMYGASLTYCQGNEMNSYSCVLTEQMICKQCEQLTEKCYCEQQTNICQWTSENCISILCSDFLTQETCSLAQDRCYWSSTVVIGDQITQGCVKECIKITDSDDCNQRTNECYYDYLITQCKKGIKTIPGLDVTIIIEQIYDSILIVYLLISLISI